MDLQNQALQLLCQENSSVILNKLIPTNFNQMNLWRVIPVSLISGIRTNGIEENPQLYMSCQLLEIRNPTDQYLIKASAGLANWAIIVGHEMLNFVFDKHKSIIPRER